MRLSIILILALLATIGALAVLFIFSLFSRGGGSEEYFADTLGFVIVFLVMSICCAVVLERHRVPRLMRSGLYAAIVAFVGWTVFVWFGDDLATLNLHIEKLVIWPSVWTGLMALVGLLFLPEPPRPWWRAVRLVTLILIVVMALHVAIATTFYPAYPSDPRTLQSTHDDYYARRYEYERTTMSIGTVISLLALAGLSTSFLLLWLTPRNRVITNRTTYWITCPRCASEQTLRTGWDRCGQCGLEICVD